MSAGNSLTNVQATNGQLVGICMYCMLYQCIRRTNLQLRFTICAVRDHFLTRYGTHVPVLYVSGLSIPYSCSSATSLLLFSPKWLYWNDIESFHTKLPSVKLLSKRELLSLHATLRKISRWIRSRRSWPCFSTLK